MTAHSARPHDTGLSDRDRRVLAVLVREYIEHGEAVSSLYLAERGGLGVSSATLRHTLSKLEDLGFVRQPHTSAGRIPTDRGYRCYVDMLLEARRPSRVTREVEARLRHTGTVDEVLAGVSHELSRASHHLGFALALEQDTEFRQIEFVPLGAGRVLVIVVATGGQLLQKMIEVRETLTADDLRQAATYLNTEFAGLPLGDVRAAVLERLQQERTLYDQLLGRALRLAQSGFEGIEPHTTFYVQGASSLLEEHEAEARPSLDTLRALFQMIEEKHRLVRLLNEYIDGPGFTVVIGAEHTAPGLRSFSLIAATCGSGGYAGTVGLIGPTRMRYSRALSIVDSFSHAIERVLLRGE